MKKLRKGMNKDENTDIPAFPTYEEVTPRNAERHEETRRPATPIVASAGDSEGSLELKVVRPAAFDEVGEIADHLLDGRTVVLNLELLDNVQIVRMLDFLNGVTYSTDGEIKNVAKNTFIITPTALTYLTITNPYEAAAQKCDGQILLLFKARNEK